MALNRKGKEAPKGVKTRASRYANRLEGIFAGWRSGRWLGVVPKSVALHNMCGDNAYGRGTK